MQNAECEMQNYGIPPGTFSIIAEGDTFILHFEFCILHSIVTMSL